MRCDIRFSCSLCNECQPLHLMWGSWRFPFFPRNAPRIPWLVETQIRMHCGFSAVSIEEVYSDSFFVMESSPRSLLFDNDASQLDKIRVLCLISLSIWLIHRLLHSIYLVYFHPLSSVPGPLLAKVSTWWQAYYQAKLLKADQVQGRRSPPLSFFD
jgi:hypothetical protein